MQNKVMENKRLISKILLTGICLCYFSMGNAETVNAPMRASLMDTGYDSCVNAGNIDCENNKNLLFRGDEPLDNTDNYTYDPEQFRKKIFSYLQQFKNTYSTNAILPASLDELKNYRIVVINLLYDWDDHGSDAEFTELTKEFRYSGFSTRYEIPEQHKMYGLDAKFNPEHFAFEWWPVTFIAESNPDGIQTNLNWPNLDIVPVPRTTQNYKPLDLPYLVSGMELMGDTENEAVDIHTLITSQPVDGHPLLIFYHCVAGVDRTGAVTMGYFMRYGGYGNVVWQVRSLLSPTLSSINSMEERGQQRGERGQRNEPLSFKQALKATTQEGYSEPKEESLVTAQSYCLTLGKDIGECDR